jgi:radical SAM protein with 4Fe4S-binding SPASM domain
MDYLRLKENWLLRGWDKLPASLVDRDSQAVSFIPPEVLVMFKQNNGVLIRRSALRTPMQNRIVEQMLEAGVLEETEHPVKLSEEQQYYKYPNRFLHSVHWSITGNCNCRCRHCYMSAPSGETGEPPLEECFDLADQMADAGVRAISLTGGEALVRKDFLQIVDRILERGMIITTIMSNGLLVTDKLLDELEARGIHPEFNMSFDGTGTHDWLRGVPGAEEAVISAFERCRDRGFPTGAEFCMHKGNKHLLRESVNRLDEAGCRSLKVNRMSVEGEAKGIADYALTAEEAFEIYYDYIPHYYEDNVQMAIMLNGMFIAHPGKKATIGYAKMDEDSDCSEYCLCGHARNYMYITSDGYCVPCIAMGSVESGRNLFPNIKDMSFAEVLSDSSYTDFMALRLADYFKKNPGCESCGFRNRCAGGCRGQAVKDSDTADVLSKDNEACLFFKNGWFDKTKALLEQYVLQDA